VAEDDPDGRVDQSRQLRWTAHQRALLPQVRHGQVVRGRIGLQLRRGPVTEDGATALKLPQASGAIVVAVERDSPASRAGLRDAITEFDGTVVVSADDLIPRVSSRHQGRPPSSRWCDGQVRALRVTVEALSPPEEQPVQVPPERTGLGSAPEDITATIARHMRLPSGLDGALVPTRLQMGRRYSNQMAGAWGIFDTAWESFALVDTRAPPHSDGRHEARWQRACSTR
jgi:hypothetical protein